MQVIGKYLILLGLVIVIIGLVMYFFENAFSWFGKLPGDIRVEKENWRLYLPITSMILISIFLTIIFNIFRRFF